jgi:hypothetical protein
MTVKVLPVVLGLSTLPHVQDFPKPIANQTLPVKHSIQQVRFPVPVPHPAVMEEIAP